MMEKNLISVIVPVYNVSEYINECILSIVNQSYREIEIILVNDGSTDKSGFICEEWKLKDPRIIVIHQSNMGLPEARNTGIKAAKGEYIIFIDSDDWIDPCMLEDLKKQIVDYNSDISVCNLVTFNKNGSNDGVLGKYKNEIIDYSNSNSLKFYYSSLDACCVHMFTSSIIVKNELLFVPKTVVAQEDFYFQIKVYTHAKRIATIKNKYYHYRERGSSISKKGQNRNFAKQCLNFTHLAQQYVTQNSDRNCFLFFEYQFINMMMTSINNVYENKLSDIVEVIKLYRSDSFYKKMNKKEDAGRLVYSDNTLQHRYYRIIVKMILLGYTYLPALLEKLRISKLRSNTRTELYFK